MFKSVRQRLLTLVIYCLILTETVWLAKASVTATIFAKILVFAALWR